MTAAAIAMLAAQVDPMDMADEWAWDDGANPDLWMYRGRTLALLKRYMRLSIEVGRLPSVLGRGVLPISQKLIAKIVLQEYTQPETARLLGCPLRNVERSYTEALDRLSEEFLQGGLLRPIPGLTPIAPKTCQEAKIDENPVSCCNEGKNIF